MTENGNGGGPDATVAVDELDVGDRTTLETFVTEWLSDERVPGASVAVVDGDDLVYAGGFGARDLASNAPATPATLYGIGSITKSVTALAVLQLVEAGAVGLEDPIAEHVPYLEGVPGEPITVHDLLCHASGMPSDGSSVVLISRDVGDPVAVPMSDRADFRRHLERTYDDRVTDGEPFFYYNAGYVVLGTLIEAIDGRSYATYVDEEILEPLGMARSTFDAADFEAAADAMTPYVLGESGPDPEAFPFARINEAPGGLLSSARELARYLRFQMGDGTFEGTRLLDPGSLERLHDRHSTRATRLDGTDRDYGYGWMVTDFLGETLIGHGGSIGVSTAYAGFLADRGLGVAVVCNTAPAAHPMAVGPGILAGLEGRAPRRAVPYFALRAKLEAVTGTYESVAGIMTATVERTGLALDITLETGLSSEALRVVPDTDDPDDYGFHGVSGTGDRLPVRFEPTETGMDLFVQRWRLHGPDA